MEPMTLEKALAKFEAFEWYDNSRLDRIQACHRKAFYSIIGPYGQPLHHGIGVAGAFGSCWHDAIAAYYSKHLSHYDYDARLRFACRAFFNSWSREFGNMPELENKYTLVRGLQQLMMYLDHFRSEDTFFDVIDSEIGFMVLVKPYQSEDFEPFVYTGRIDRVLGRRTRSDNVIGETKTTGGDPIRRARELRLDRQTRGYAKMARLLGVEISGVVPDVVQISSLNMDPTKAFIRDYFPLTELDGDSWRNQTIGVVEQWRTLKRRAKGLSVDKGNAGVLDTFDQSTKECMRYGICTFYDMCVYGVNPTTVQKYSVDKWHPLKPTTEIITTEI